jgi:hypothetical protein
MKLNSDGVTISILILITMILICHTMNYLYPKNKFTNIPQVTNYNKIYYSNKNNKLCSNINTGGDINSNMLTQADIPYDIVSSCSNDGNFGGIGGASGSGGAGGTGGGADNGDLKKYLETLSDSELVVLYKVIYEETQREIINRALNDLSKKN